MRTFGRYESRRVLSGGSTPLHLCFDPLVGRSVVVRTLCHSLALDPERRSRFLDSAVLAAQVSSPHVAPVLDLGHADGDPYVVMELPDGSSLRAEMDGPRPKAVEFRVNVISQLCDALVDAHAHGVTQLGLRPTGILVDEAGHVTVVPFGVFPIHGSRGTLAALSLDEIAYLAPELVQGHVADRRADIFSLGVIAFELMARRRPFWADNIPALLHALVSERPTFEPAVCDPSLERVILKALATDPSDRYADAGIMLVELADLGWPAAPGPSSEVADASPGSSRQAREAGARAASEVASRSSGGEDLRAAALSCAAEGDFEAAEALADRVEREQPGDTRNDLLRAYLREERATGDLLATAERHLAAGRTREARAAAAEALTLDPWRAPARALLCRIDRALYRAKGHPAPAVGGGA